MSKLLDYCTISGKPVTHFDGIRKYIATADISEGKIINYEMVKYSTKPSRANQNVENNELLFAKMMNTLKIIQIDDSNVDNIYSTGFYVLKSQIVPRYLYWFLNSNSFNTQKDKYCTGTTMKAINNAGLKKIEISSIPDVIIQKRRIEELDLIQYAIENRKNMICDCNNLIDSKFNEVIEHNIGYEKLEKLCVLKARIGWQGLTKKEYLKEGNYKLITGIDFQDGKIDFDNCVYVSEERYNQDKNIQIKNNDILITKDGTIGKVAYVDIINFPATLNSGVFVVRTIDKRIKEKYLYYLLKAKYFQDFVDKIKTGATIPHLNQAAFYNFIIPIIDDNTQKEFITDAELIEKQKELLSNDLKELTLLLEIKLHEYFDLED